MDVHHSVVEAADVIRRSCAVAPVVAIVSETGRRRAVAATSCDLAEKILRAGRSVAVADCDFQDPMLDKFWKRDASLGLSSVLVGARSIEDVFDYRALPTGRFLTVTAGDDAATRAHLFATPSAENAVRRLVDFAEVVLLNVGPLSAPHARDVVAICDAIVVVTAPDHVVQAADRPLQLHRLRAPIIAWIRDLHSSPGEEVDGPPPAAPSVGSNELMPGWIDDDTSVANLGDSNAAPANGSARSVVPHEAAPEAIEVVPERDRTEVIEVSVDRETADVERVLAGDEASDDFEVADLWEVAPTKSRRSIPGASRPAVNTGSDSDLAKKKRKRLLGRSRYLH